MGKCSPAAPLKRQPFALRSLTLERWLLRWEMQPGHATRAATCLTGGDNHGQSLLISQLMMVNPWLIDGDWWLTIAQPDCQFMPLRSMISIRCQPGFSIIVSQTVDLTHCKQNHVKNWGCHHCLLTMVNACGTPNCNWVSCWWPSYQINLRSTTF